MLNVIMLRRLALRVATVLQYSCNTKLPTQDDCYDYGLYPLVDRYSTDQVPQQNRGPKGTVVADKGTTKIIKRCPSCLFLPKQATYTLDFLHSGLNYNQVRSHSNL